MNTEPDEHYLKTLATHGLNHKHTKCTSEVKNQR